MDLQNLKRVYNAARALNGHTQMEAAKKVGKSITTINNVLSGRMVSKPAEDAIALYIYSAGLGDKL